MELLGLGEPLFWVFAFVGAFAGIAAGIERTVKVVDGVYSIIQRHIDIRQKRLALKKALAEAEEQGRVTSLPVEVAPSQADIAYRAERLGGRVSPEARRHKIEQSHDLQATAAYVLPRYCRRIRLYQVR